MAETFTLDQLEHYVVAASLQNTDTLELVHAKYADRINGRLGSLLKAASAYFTVTRGLLSRDALASILSRNEPDPTKHQDYLALYDSLTAPPYTELPEDKARWYLHEFDYHWKLEQTGEALAAAATALRHGHESHGQQLRGAEAAWQLLAEARVEFETRHSTSLSESEITAAADQAEREYQLASTGGPSLLPFKLPELNGVFGGYRPAAFHIYTAFAAEGKSMFMLNDAHSIWKNGGNVAIATGEMSEAEYRARLYGLHSCEHKFDHPIPTRNIEEGKLSKEDLKIFKNVLEDIRDTPTYGKLFIFQFPRLAPPSLIFNKFALYDQVVPLDAVVIDYLGLLSSDQRRVTRREELDDLIRHCRSLSLDFDKGRSVPCITGYQVNRESYRRALTDGFYTLDCFAECAQAEQSCTSAVWLLSLQNNPDQLKIGALKNRGGDLGQVMHVGRDFKHSRVHSLQTGRAAEQKKAATSILDI